MCVIRTYEDELKQEKRLPRKGDESAQEELKSHRKCFLENHAFCHVLYISYSSMEKGMVFFAQEGIPI